MIVRFRERWEKLKESAKRKKEAKAAADTTNVLGQRIEEDPEADEDDAACASTLAARAPRLCCPRRDSFGYSHVSPRRVH